MEGYQDLKDRIERFIDSNSVGAVVTMLAEICAEKAEHVRTNWQDEATARVWDKSSKMLDKLYHRLD